MSQDNGPLGKIVLLTSLAAGVIAIYEWLKNSECNTPGSMAYGSSVCGWLGMTPAATTPSTTTAPPATTTATPAIPQTPAAANTLGQQIQALAGQGVTSLDMDQWNYYYNQILAGRGQPGVSSATFELMLASAGLSDATRSTPISLSQFLAALTSQGLSGYFNSWWVPGSYIHNPGAF